MSVKLIVGLGNPGKEYENTRHNVGFSAIDVLAADLGLAKTDWKESKKAHALYAKAKVNSREAELVKPTTFMNNSGLAVSYAKKKHDISPADIIVIHDDKDIALGEYRIQTNRGAAGHNGVKSIIDHLGTQNFTRVRVGIAPDKAVSDTASFVLNKLTAKEKIIIEGLLEEVAEKIIGLLK